MRRPPWWFSSSVKADSNSNRGKILTFKKSKDLGHLDA
ncbi:hypothetical protein LEMLEM_LOCUS7943 [Lemmus lemmus]